VKKNGEKKETVRKECQSLIAADRELQNETVSVPAAAIASVLFPEEPMEKEISWRALWKQFSR